MIIAHSNQSAYFLTNAPMKGWRVVLTKRERHRAATARSNELPRGNTAEVSVRSVGEAEVPPVAEAEAAVDLSEMGWGWAATTALLS